MKKSLIAAVLFTLFRPACPAAQQTVTLSRSSMNLFRPADTVKAALKAVSTA